MAGASSMVENTRAARYSPLSRDCPAVLLSRSRGALDGGGEVDLLEVMTFLRADSKRVIERIVMEARSTTGCAAEAGARDAGRGS
jgi:hypothetical protein